MRLTTIEANASRCLDTPMIVAQALEPVDVSRLTASESLQLDELRFEHRRRDWLSGRRALKTLLHTLGRSDDTSAISFPDSRLSLTHADGLSLAAGTTATCTGIGIDYEPLRVVDERIGRWFLSAQETEWLRVQPGIDRSAHLIRLWTIKEAAFKSCPDNQRLTLRELRIAKPGADYSMVVSLGEDRIQVFCTAWLSGFLSIAKFEGTK
jgi:4'-phosphopantetheinyl transferase EntD